MTGMALAPPHALGPPRAPYVCSEDWAFEDWAFDDMLKWSVELAGKLRLEPLLRDAELLAAAAGDAGASVVAEALAASGPA